MSSVLDGRSPNTATTSEVIGVPPRSQHHRPRLALLVRQFECGPLLTHQASAGPDEQ